MPNNNGRYLRFAFVLIGLGTAGCAGNESQPYSPNYSRIPMNGTSGAVVRKGYEKDFTTQTVLFPDACITPDTADQSLYLPSGCANNLNLQLMAVKKQDLERGREMGPAMAAPVARAAQNYIAGVAPKDRHRAQDDQSTQPFNGQ